MIHTAMRTAAHFLLIIVCLITPCLGDQGSKRSGGEPQKSPSTKIPALLTDEPYSIPNLGLSVYLPEDTLVDLSRIEGGRTNVVITPQGRDRVFVFQIMQSVSVDRDLDLRQALTNMVEHRRSFHSGKDQNNRTISTARAFDLEENLLVGQHPAARVYIDVPIEPDAPVTGYTLFNTGPGQFVIFQMDCHASVFPRVRELYELMVASVQFKDPDDLGSDRAAAILAGKALLERFNSEDFNAVLDSEPAYYRLYVPGATGAASDDTEVGYQRVHLCAGHAGDLDPSRPKSKWTASDQKPGYIARIEARALAADVLIDTVSIFFLSADRTNELWSITMLVRKGSDRERWVETGIRRDNRLTVKTTRTGEAPTNADWSPLPQGYMSRVESYLLPRLICRAGLSGLFGFYIYDSNVAKMTLRRETLTPVSAAQGEPPPLSNLHAFTLSTLASENSRVTTTDLDAKGHILRRVMPDGSVMEPIDGPRLKRLWADKKLPLD